MFGHITAGASSHHHTIQQTSDKNLTPPAHPVVSGILSNLMNNVFSQIDAKENQYLSIPINDTSGYIELSTDNQASQYCDPLYSFSKKIGDGALWLAKNILAATIKGKLFILIISPFATAAETADGVGDIDKFFYTIPINKNNLNYVFSLLGLSALQALQSITLNIAVTSKNFDEGANILTTGKLPEEFKKEWDSLSGLTRKWIALSASSVPLLSICSSVYFLNQAQDKYSSAPGLSSIPPGGWLAIKILIAFCNMSVETFSEGYEAVRELSHLFSTGTSKDKLKWFGRNFFTGGLVETLAATTMLAQLLNISNPYALASFFAGIFALSFPTDAMLSGEIALEAIKAIDVKSAGQNPKKILGFFAALTPSVWLAETIRGFLVDTICGTESIFPKALHAALEVLCVPHALRLTTIMTYLLYTESSTIANTLCCRKVDEKPVTPKSTLININEKPVTPKSTLKEPLIAKNRNLLFTPSESIVEEPPKKSYCQKLGCVIL